jgi:hypothetical protein
MAKCVSCAGITKEGRNYCDKCVMGELSWAQLADLEDSR